jgi:hypothetical protein
MRRVLALSSLLSLSGCASVPQDAAERTISDGAEVARTVELCKTGIADLQSRLGPPSRDGLLGSSRVVTWIVEWDPLVKYLGVMTNESGTVVDLYWNLPSEVTWAPTDRCR